MNIYPAIDLRNGKVVRLKYGDPNQQTTYSDDPIETARRWAEAGAAWIHVVNLDGAFGDDAGAAVNRSLLQSLTTVGPKIQFGGGLRSMADIEAALSRGVARVVILAHWRSSSPTCCAKPSSVLEPIGWWWASTRRAGASRRAAGRATAAAT